MTDGLVDIAQGRLQGHRDGRAWSWRGVPYAKPPVGDQRFRSPEPPEPWTGTRDAAQFGPAAPQRVGWFAGGAARDPAPSEDCLHLNIWSPAADGRRRPVMVWVHGGAFVAGSGALYRGAPLASLGDIVVVTINYRLGVFGFVNLGGAIQDERIGGNLGLRDVMAALRWVRDNIVQFGGDPGRVTLAGESAGAIMVSLLMVAAAAAPLFDQAILQSGVFTLVHPHEGSCEVAEAYLDHIGVRAGALSGLQALSTADLLEAQHAVGERLNGISPAAPWFDGVLVPGSYAEARNVAIRPIPLLAGANRDEITLFKAMPGIKVLRTRRAQLLDVVDRDLETDVAARICRAYADTREGNRALGSDLNFVMPTLHVAERHAAAGAPTWVYRFDYPHPALGAYHALELLFQWPFPGLLGAMLRGGFLTGLRSGLSDRMRAAWASFVRTGAPGDDWPNFTLPHRSTRLFDRQDRVVADPMRLRREAWSGRDVEAGR